MNTDRHLVADVYAVVGCGECGALWVVEGRPESTGCPRCGTRHRFDRLRRFVETDDEDRARQARASMLAERSGHGDAFDDLDSFADLGARLDDVGVSDEEYLGAAGIDLDAVAEAAEEATTGRGGGGRSRRAVVESALRELDAPTEASVVDYAAERGVPRAAARRLLDRLVSSGAATVDEGGYRLL